MQQLNSANSSDFTPDYTYITPDSSLQHAHSGLPEFYQLTTELLPREASPLPSYYYFLLIAISVMAICFILGVPGNIAVMVHLTGWLKEGSFTPRLMLNLAISDLLTLICLPVWIWALLNGWIFGGVMCKLLSYLVYLNIYCNILCVTLMSVQRYLQVLHPQKWKKLGRKGENILLSGMWMLSGLMSCYAPVQYAIYERSEGRFVCFHKFDKVGEIVATLIWEFIVFLVSFFLLSYFYFQLYRGVNNTAFFRSTAMTKVVTRIVVCYFIFWVPYHICNTVLISALLLKKYSLLRSAIAVNIIGQVLVIMNSCVNPFLYAFSARAVQQPTASQ